MWLHIPQPRTTSQSPAASAASTSRLTTEVAELLARSATWRTRPRPPAYWQRAWQTEGSLQLLSGLTCTPSTASRGADSWMASLAATRANHLASPGRSAGLLTNATYGLQSNALSTQPDQAGASSRMWQDTFGLDTSIPSGQVLSDAVSNVRNRSLRRLTSARHIVASEYSFSLWSTPAARQWRGTGSNVAKIRANAAKRHEPQLEYQAVLHSLRHQTTRPDGNGQMPQDGRPPQLNPKFVEWLMGLPEGWMSTGTNRSGCSATP